MSDPAADRTDRTNGRLTAVETALTHLEHELSQMHSVLLAHTAELDALNRRIEKFEGRLERLAEGPEETDPRAHKPPHY